MCSCQTQTPASENQLAEWPFHSFPLIPLDPPIPLTVPQLESLGINEEKFQENSEHTIAVVGCKWGGSHIEVCRGICKNLASQGYHTFSIDLPEVLIAQDKVRNFFLTRWLGKKWSTATVFESLLQEKAFACINFLRWIFSKTSSKAEISNTSFHLVVQELLKVKPDAIITTYTPIMKF